MKIGDKVRVMKNADGIRWFELHRGIIVKKSTAFVNVFNPEREIGDTIPDYAEAFAISSKCIRVEPFGR